MTKGKCDWIDLDGHTVTPKYWFLIYDWWKLNLPSGQHLLGAKFSLRISSTPHSSGIFITNTRSSPSSSTTAKTVTLDQRTSRRRRRCKRGSCS